MHLPEEKEKLKANVAGIESFFFTLNYRYQHLKAEPPFLAYKNIIFTSNFHGNIVLLVIKSMHIFNVCISYNDQQRIKRKERLFDYFYA